jgi:hypothetical protein
MHLQVRGGEEKWRNTRVRSLASRWAWAHDVRVNSPQKFG